MSAMITQLQDILRFIVDNLQSLKVVESAPATTEMEEIGDEAGNVKSDIIILHDSTQTNRALYYRYKGTVYKIDSA